MKNNNINFDILPKTTDILPKHDLVFGSPINDASAGIPIGDGDTGSLIWLEADGLHIHINKTDLWDFSDEISEYFCSHSEENLTCLRHGGEIVIRFNSPCFDMIYQKDFQARLSLSDATMHLRSQTAFSSIKANCFASNKNKVTALNLQYDMPEAEAPCVTLTRWGSKNFWRWYYQTKRDHTAGLSGTETQVEDSRIYIKQKLNGTQFCIGVAVVTDQAHTEHRINSHTGKINFSSSCSGNITLYWNISLGDNVEQAKENTKKALDCAIAEGFYSMHAVHTKEWFEFWNTSLISIPHDYIENCYYLSLYYSNSECRGAYAPLFTSGIWGFRHDFYPWTYYFHYNMQHMYGPLEPSGHGKLAENYYKMRRNGLEVARKFAKEVKNADGAFYHDVTDLLGRGAAYDGTNCTPGAQIAMAMYRHYRMSGDKDFLEKTALPVMKAVAEFYLSYLKKEEDGLYHIHKTAAYEGTPLFHDTITDMVMIRALFSVLKDFASQDQKSLFIDIIEHLPDYILVPMDKDEISDGKLLLGFGKGKTVQGDGLVFAIGRDDNGNPVRKNYGDPTREFYGFPDTEMSPLYPAGVFGLKNRESQEFSAMINQILLHREPKGCMHWCMMPLYMARMGMARELYEYLEETISTWLIFPNGLGVEGPMGITEVRDRLKYNTVCETESGEKTENEAYGFRHYDMEALPIVAHSVCESLLQSYDGIIRICPAIEKKDAVMFCLYAEGGFRVCGNVSKETLCITIESLRGEPCFVLLPDFADQSNLKFYIKTQAEAEAVCDFSPVWETVGNEKVLSLSNTLKSGDTLLITNSPQQNNKATNTAALPNKNWKTCGNAHLGTPALP